MNFFLDFPNATQQPRLETTFTSFPSTHSNCKSSVRALATLYALLDLAKLLETRVDPSDDDHTDYKIFMADAPLKGDEIWANIGVRFPTKSTFYIVAISIIISFMITSLFIAYKPATVR